MSLFFWKKKKRKDIQAAKEIDFPLYETSDIDKKKVGNDVLDHCEAIISAAKELEEQKKEYQIITAYLTDMQTISDLSEEERKPIEDTAEQVLRLNETRNQYLNQAKRISDAQFALMERMEKEIPDAIVRLQTNEAYQATVKRDMTYLEGEKLQWSIYRKELAKEKKRLRTASYILLSLFLIFLIFLFLLQAGFDLNITYAWIVLAFLAVIGGFLILIRYQEDTAEMKQAETNANHAIGLLNKVKIKYVNITNAVDYAREKFHVSDGKDFAYQWEQYQEAVRERERYMRTNEDLEYFNGKLVRLLKQYALYDSRVWLDHPEAILNPSEMAEQKHQLLVRRQKLRARIQSISEIVKTERDKIDELMKQEPDYEAEIREIIASVDLLSSEGEIED